MEFKDRIKQLRTGKGLTSAKLAADFEKSESAVRMWETGKTKPDADTLIKLSEYFYCTTDYLLGLSNAKNEQEQEELDEISKSIQEAIGSSDRLVFNPVKFLIKNIIKINNWQFIPNGMNALIISSLSSLTHFILDIMESMYVARNASRQDSIDKEECYSIMLDIRNAYKMELRIQSEIAGLCDMLIGWPSAKIKKALENAGHDADFIRDHEEEKESPRYEPFDYLEAAVYPNH